MKQVLFPIAIVVLLIAGFVFMPGFGSYLMMIGLITLLVVAHEMGHLVVAKKCGVKVERFGFGLPFGPTLFEKKLWGINFVVHPLLAGAYVGFPDDDPDSDIPPDSLQRFENQPIPQRAAIALAGITVNAIMGYLLMLLVLSVWGMPTGFLGVAKLNGPATPAAIAGLQPGDLFLKANGVRIKDQPTLAKVMAAHKGEPVALDIRRGKTEKTVQITPDATGKIQVYLAAYQRYEKIQNPLAIPGEAYWFLQDKMVQNFQAIGEIFNGKRSVKELSGPVGIIGQGGQLIREYGLPVGLMITALISEILAIMNLLPIPMLDGGHILFMVIEAIQGKPLKKEIQEGLIQVCFFALIGLMGLILWNDLHTIKLLGR